ncbi:MAG TPA: ribonuclease D [Rhodanobacteraceae bacterium]
MDGTAHTLTPNWADHAGALDVPADGALLGVDTEFMRRNTFYPKLALVQVAHGDACWLVDPLAYPTAPDLRALVGGRVCVMHSASEDLEALAPLLGDTALQLFDTQIAAALCGMGAGLSYQKLVACVCHVDIPKDETRSDWLQRPLTPGQVVYAAQDVAYLGALHDALLDALERRGRAAWHAEDCARLVERAHRNHTEIDAQPQRAFAAASEWPIAAQARLQRVLLWRETTARTLDRPRPWLLDDAHALQLAQQPPATAQELFDRVKGQRALRGAQRAELLVLLQAPVTPADTAALQPIPPAPHGAVKRAVAAMRDVVQTIAADLDLPAGLLCPRRLLEQFAVARTWPDDLAGWRAGLLRDKLTPLLPD